MQRLFKVNGDHLGHGALVTRALLSAEQQIALVSRCRPINWQAEEQRLIAQWSAGKEAAPQLGYAPRPELSGLARDLVRLRDLLEPGAVAQLYRERIDELLSEVALVDAVGSCELPALSRLRYEAPFGQSAALDLARQWLVGVDWTMDGDERVRSDDESTGYSLLSRVRFFVGQERLPFRVEVSSSLVSLAATGEDFIVVAAGRHLSRMDAERVAVHEVFGHALPRARARSEQAGLFTTGSAGGNDLQEGYAVYCEQSKGALHPLRRAELALRHLAAVAVWRGCTFTQTARELLAHGTPVATAVRVALRVFRGGGLAREGAYLPAYCELLDRLRVEQDVLAWLDSGRLSLHAIEVLRQEGYRLRNPQSRNSATTGT